MKIKKDTLLCMRSRRNWEYVYVYPVTLLLISILDAGIHLPPPPPHYPPPSRLANYIEC
jgi:hypothetical protein